MKGKIGYPEKLYESPRLISKSYKPENRDWSRSPPPSRPLDLAQCLILNATLGPRL